MADRPRLSLVPDPETHEAILLTYDNRQLTLRLRHIYREFIYDNRLWQLNEEGSAKTRRVVYCEVNRALCDKLAESIAQSVACLERWQAALAQVEQSYDTKQ